MLIVAIGWIFVVAMASIAEALSPQGTVLGAFFTFVLYGLLPLSLVLYVLATPARKKALRQAEQDAASAARGDPDRGGHTAAGATGDAGAAGAAAPVTPERKEP